MTESPEPAVSVAETEIDDLKKLLHHLIESCADPAFLVELYYYSAEPDLLRMIRSYIAMPPNAKKLLALFFELTQAHSETISAAVYANGDLTLSSPASVGLAELVARDILSGKTTVTLVQ